MSDDEIETKTGMAIARLRLVVESTEDLADDVGLCSLPTGGDEEAVLELGDLRDLLQAVGGEGPTPAGGEEMLGMRDWAVFDQHGEFRGRVRCLDEGEAVTTVSDHHPDPGSLVGVTLRAVMLPFEVVGRAESATPAGKATGHEAILSQPLKIVWGNDPTTDQARHADFVITDDGKVVKNRPGSGAGASAWVDRVDLCCLAVGVVHPTPGLLETLGLDPDVKVVVERTPARVLS